MIQDIPSMHVCLRLINVLRKKQLRILVPDMLEGWTFKQEVQQVLHRGCIHWVSMHLVGA
jgi:hypothetical protein